MEWQVRASGKWSSVAFGRIATVIFTFIIPIMGTRSRPVRNTDGKAGADNVTKVHTSYTYYDY
jgi:hypothetical protein